MNKEIQKKANKLARTAGASRATEIRIGSSDRVVERVKPGYRKYTTGEYVSSAYRANFGWKNTYYQKAITIVEIAA